MLKIKHNFAIKKWIRILLISVIFIQLVLVSIQLWEYFYKLVIQGISTSSFKPEGNFFVRLLNFFEIGIGSLIKEYIVNICIPALLFVFLRDRDRDFIDGTEMTEAIKEGFIEGANEIAHTNEIAHNQESKKTEETTQSNVNSESSIESEEKTNTKDEVNLEANSEKLVKSVDNKENDLEDFFKSL